MSLSSRLGYPVFLLQHVMEQHLAEGMKIGVLYDISCVLDKHIKVFIWHCTVVMKYAIVLFCVKGSDIEVH